VSIDQDICFIKAEFFLNNIFYVFGSLVEDNQSDILFDVLFNLLFQIYGTND